MHIYGPYGEYGGWVPLSLPLWALALFVLVPQAAEAQISWAVAQREPAQIQSLVDKLEPYVADLPGQDSADAVILFSQVQTRVEGFCPLRTPETSTPASSMRARAASASGTP